MKLYSYYRSSCSWRVRIVLELKQLKYEYVAVDLLDNEQSSPDYLKLNPSASVPCLALDDGTILCQSAAIMEYLEDVAKQGKLLPDDPLARAMVRQAVNIISCDTQPLQNLRVIRAMGEGGREWAGLMISRGLSAFNESIIKRYSGKYSVGDG